MKKWVVGIVVVVLALILSLSFYLYKFGGLREYIRTITVINSLSDEEKKLATSEMTGTDLRGAERGILAGSWFGRVWMWNSYGLRSFVVDEFSVYSIFDGCSDDARDRLKMGLKNAINTEISTSYTRWKERAKTGDFVTVYVALPESGGTLGNLREIYSYNFWLFLPVGIDAQCAK